MRRPGRARAGRVLGATVAALLAFVTAGATAAAGATAPPTSIPTEAHEAVSAHVSVDAPAVVEPGDPVAVSLAVTNGGAVPLDGAEAVLAVTRDPLSSVEELTAFLADGRGDFAIVARGDVGTAVTLPPVGEADPEATHRLAAGQTASMRLVAGADALPFGDAWGVHGLAVALRTQDGTLRVQTSALTIDGDGMPRLTVAALAPAYGSALEVREAVDASGIPGVALAVDATRLAPGGATTVALAARETFRLPARHPDLVSLSHAGDDAFLPYALERSLGGPLSAVRDAPWIALVDVADRPTAALAAAHGAAALVVAPAEGEPAAAVAETPEGDLAVLTPSAALSARVSAASESGAEGRAVATAALLADAGTGTALVTTTEEWNPAPATAGDALAAVVGAPFVDTITVGELVSAGEERIVLPESADEDRDLAQPTVAGLSDRLARLATLSAVAEDPAAVLDPGAEALLTPLATDLRGEDLLRRLRTSQARVEVDQTLSALGIATGSEVNLIAASGSLPVTVRNDLDVDATVWVDITSFSPNLQIRSTPTVTVPAGATESVLVEVEGVSSANVIARIVLRTPEGGTVGEAATMTVRVRADWGNAVTAIFTGGLVLLLAMGVIRTVRRGRKETRTGPRDEPAAPGGD